MKKINISTKKYPNMFTLVDDEDFDWLNQWKWCPHMKKYVARGIKKAGKSKTILIHREILNPEEDLFIDHIDGNPLNNQRNNLRFCTSSENPRNCKLYKNNTSGYKGVSWQKKNRKWIVHVRLKNTSHHIGLFSSKKDAAIAYNQAALKYHGKFASLNMNI